MIRLAHLTDLCQERFPDAGKTNAEIILDQQAHFASGCTPKAR